MLVIVGIAVNPLIWTIHDGLIIRAEMTMVLVFCSLGTLPMVCSTLFFFRY